MIEKNKTYIRKLLGILHLSKWFYVAVGVWDLKNRTRLLAKNAEIVEDDKEGKV